MNKTEKQKIEKAVIKKNTIERGNDWLRLFDYAIKEIKKAHKQRNRSRLELAVGYARGVAQTGYVTGIMTRGYRGQCFDEIEKLEKQ